MVAGMKRTRSTADPRLPITVPILHRLLDSLANTITQRYERTLVASMFALAFHAVLRVGEFTTRYGKQISEVLSMEDISMISKPDSKEVIVSLRKFKHSAAQGPQSIRISATKDKQYCPVDRLSQFLKVRGTSPGPLFRLQDRSPCSDAMFRRHLNEALAFCDLNPRYYKAHSFRIGAATEAAANGCTDAQIRNMGRWQSDAYRKYIRLSASYLKVDKY